MQTTQWRLWGRGLAIAMVALVAGGCAASTGKSLSTGTANPSGLPPVEAFFSDARIRSAVISPNGQKIAFLTTLEGAPTIGVLDVASFDRKGILAFPDADLQINWLSWANDERILFSTDVPLSWSVGVRARGSLLFGIDGDGQNLRHMGSRWFGRTGSRGKPDYEEIHRVPIQFEDDIVAWLPDDPQHVLIAVSPPTQRRASGVYEMDVTTGDLDPVVRAQQGVQEWFSDPSGWIGMGLGVAGAEIYVLGRGERDAPFREVARYHVSKGMSFDPLGLSSKPGIAFVSSPHETGRGAIYEYDLGRKRFGRRVFSHPQVDAGGLIYSRQKKKYLGVRYVEDRPRAFFWDQEAAAEQAAIDRALPGRYNRIESRSRDGRLALVKSSSDTVAPRVYLYDRDRRNMEELYMQYPDLEGVRLATTRAATYRARDGLEIPAYVTIPAGAEPKNLPLVVYPHGGPWARDYIGFDRAVQFLASRGYAVLQMNFRGSTGYGAKFTQLGYEKLGQEMQDDLTDGVQWLIDQGVADPSRIAIYGASYGGYASLMGAAKTPDLFQCAASYAGVTDLEALMDEWDWYDADTRSAFAFGRDPAMREKYSPVNLVASIEIPILIGHGEDDSRVHFSQAKSMASALRSAGKPVELVLFEDEIHGSRAERNRIEWWTRLAAFLDRCLSKPAA